MRKYNAWCSCGWHGSYASDAVADYARRKHSCAKWGAARAKARRNRDRMAAVDRTPRDCTHTHTTHQHGTYACYVLDGCRCHPCAAANSRYEQDRIRRNAYGRSELIDAGPIRDHITTLTQAGIGYKRIARLSGVSTGTLTKIIYGITRADGTRRPPAARVRRETARKILAIQPDPAHLADGAVVDATGTRRRIQALYAIGWSTPAICDGTGIDRQALDKVLRGSATTTAATRRAITRLYDDLWDQTPPETNQRERISASRARSRARAARWAPPLAWDDGAIDDPDAAQPEGWREGECSEPGCPNQARTSGVCRRHYEAGRRGATPGTPFDLDEWAHLVRLGETPARAAQRIGVSLTTVETYAYRDRPDVVALLNEARQVAA